MSSDLFFLHEEIHRNLWLMRHQPALSAQIWFRLAHQLVTFILA